MKIRIVDQLYLFCVKIGIIFTTISLTSLATQVSWMKTVSNCVLLLLCIIQIVRIVYLLQKNKNKLLLWCFCAFLLFIGYRIAGDRTIFEAFIYGTGAIFVDYKKIIKTMKSTWIVGLMIVVLLSLMHLIPTSGGIRESGEVRMSLGFVHPNALGFILFIVGILIFIDFYENRKQSLFVLFILTFVAYYIANSKTSTLLLIVLDIMMIARIFKKDIISKILSKKMVDNLLLIFVVLLLFFSFWLAASYTGSAFQLWLNNLLTNRIQYGAWYMSLYGISFLGRNIPDFVLWYDNFTLIYLDNGYLLLLIKFGVFATFIYMMMIFQSSRKAIREKNIAMIVTIVLIAVSLFSEQSALRWCFCPILMYGSAMEKIKK